MSLDDSSIYVWLDDNKFRSSYWNHIENQKFYADWMSKKLNLNEFEQWYTITPEIIKLNHGSTIISRFYENNMYLFLKSVYPDFAWFKEKFNINNCCIKLVEPQLEVVPVAEQPQISIQPQGECKVQ